MTWSSVHGIISLQIAKCHDPWVDWRDLRTTAEHIIDALIRGILRDATAGLKGPAGPRGGSFCPST